MKKIRTTPCQSVKTALKGESISIWCGCCTPDNESWVTDPAGKAVRLPEYRLRGMSRDNLYPWLTHARTA